MRFLAASIASVVWLGLVAARPADIYFDPLTETSDGVMESGGTRDAQALQEMFGSSERPPRWRQTPSRTDVGDESRHWNGTE